MIGLIAAEKEEVGNLVKSLKAKILEFNGIRYYIGNINDKHVVLCFCGMGKANAAAVAMNMVVNFGVDKIFNIGLCGSCHKDVAPGTVLVADNCQYNDVDLTSLDYPLNQIPNELISYSIKPEYVNFLRTTVSSPIVGTIASGDTFITLSNIEAFPHLADKKIVGFDMEACAIAQICYKTKTDFLCMKIVSDNLLFDTDSKNLYRANLKDLPKQIEGICKIVLEYYSK